ncbi:hypothetical protein O181_122211 [Austropuccinia psidii MF-1]|uniref:Uncharacterized protein n=1 Tax=Austropuccinia psidii MF-1 TaxID=1389203 RepID=A0A9Q3KL28_9BASI|nr:hypothetical protein [Austropuccinia psidii MF-1]
MERAAPLRRGGVKSRRSRSFSGLLGGYPSIPQGPRSRLGEAEDEEGEESEETEVAAALAGVPEASEAPSLSLSNQPLVSQDEPSFLKMIEQPTQFMGKNTQEVAPRDMSACDSKPEHKQDSQNTINQWYSQDTTKTWS